MTEFWDDAFQDKQLMWGLEPTASASLAADSFARAGVRDVLIPGIGYGRNAKPFLARGMAVTGIEISPTAIAFARTKLGLEFPIHEGSVEQMPFDDRLYDGVFCYGLLYLLDEAGRAKVLRDCFRQLRPGGQLFFTVVSKTAPMYGQGEKLGEDWYQRFPNLKMFFYGPESIRREFGVLGAVEVSEIDEPGQGHGGASLPFLNAVVTKPLS